MLGWKAAGLSMLQWTEAKGQQKVGKVEKSVSPSVAMRKVDEMQVFYFKLKSSFIGNQMYGDISKVSGSAVIQFI